MSLNNEPCTTRRTLIDLNTDELNYYLLMIIPDKCNEICNAVDDLSAKISFPTEKKGRKR